MLNKDNGRSLPRRDEAEVLRFVGFRCEMNGLSLPFSLLQEVGIEPDARLYI
jgi:hypothetical protein